MTLCRDMIIRNSKYHEGCIWDPMCLGEGEVIEGQRWYRSKRVVVSYRLSIVTIVVSMTIWPQFVIECLWCSNQQVSGTLWGKVWRGKG